MLHFTVEFWIVMIANLFLAMAIVLTYLQYKKHKHRIVIFFLFEWISFFIWNTIGGLAYLFSSLPLYMIHIVSSIPTYLFLLLIIDSLLRYDIDPRKISVFTVFATGIVILGFNSSYYVSAQFPNGDWTFGIRGLLNWWFIIVSLLQTTLWLYTIIKIHQLAMPELKRYSSITLIGGFFTAVMPYIIIFSGLLGVFPGSVFLSGGIGAFIISISLEQDPRLWQLLISKSNDARVLKLRQMEIQLSQSEQKFRNLVENAGEIIMEFDLAGNISYNNKISEELLGYTNTELLQHPLSQFIISEDYETILPIFTQSPPIPLHNIKLHLKSATSTILTVLTNIVPQFNDANQIVDYILIARNITDLEENEKLLSEQNRLLIRSQRIESIGVLAGGIAHDFSNILQAISGLTEMMMFEQPQDSELAKNMAQILNTCSRGSTLVKQLLYLIRKDDSQYKPFDIYQVIRETGTILANTLPKMIKIQYELEPGIKTIHGDPTQIQQVFMNLIINARDAMPDGGIITIKSHQIEIDSDMAKLYPTLVEGRYLWISVIDTGIGMNEAVQNHLFEPLFTTKGPGKGTGLGLSVAYRIIRNHKGIIQCYSQEKIGTEFKIFLPLLLEDQLGQLESASVNLDTLHGSESILVVDDEDIIRAYLQHILRRYGYAVITADSAERARDILQSYSITIDLILLDLNMPGMGGKQFLDELAANNSIQTKIVIVSGYSKFDSFTLASQARVSANLVKPFNSKDLLGTIQSVLHPK